jgi:Ca-activated chloride channel family protein
MTGLRYGHFLRGIAGIVCCVLALVWCAQASSGRAAGAVVVLDSSRSMWGQLDGLPKYQLVHEAFRSIAERPAAFAPFGLVSFGDQSPTSCTDVHVRAIPDAASSDGFFKALATLRPWGLTPMALALETAAGQFGADTSDRNIVLITDSTEACRGDPCAVAARIEALDPALVVDVIALDMTDSDRGRLACIADATGGTLHAVSSRAELEIAVATVSARITGAAASLAAIETGDTPLEPDGVVIQAAGTTEVGPAEPPSFTPLPDGVFTMPREQFRVPPALALPGAVPPLPQINPFWQFKLMANLRPRDKPVHLIDRRDFEIMEDMPPEFEPVDTSPTVADAEPQMADTIETGSVSDPADDAGTEPETVTAQEPPDAAAATEPEPQGDAATGAPEIDARSAPDADHQGLRLRARLTAAMEPISRPVQWTVYAIEGSEPGLWPQVAVAREPQPMIALAPGDYQVEAHYGHAMAAKPLTVAAGSVTDATFVLNAGGLRILSHLVFVDAPPNEQALHFIYAGETDENGMRDLIARSEIQGEIIRLNAGRYHVISRLGSANSVVETDVEVNPGVLTAVEINHKAGVVKLAVPNAQVEPAAVPVILQILDEAGAIVARMHGQSGHAILAPGTYTAIAESAGRSDRREFEIRIGEAMTIDFTLQ